MLRQNPFRAYVVCLKACQAIRVNKMLIVTVGACLLQLVDVLPRLAAFWLPSWSYTLAWIGLCVLSLWAAWPLMLSAVRTAHHGLPSHYQMQSAAIILGLLLSGLEIFRVAHDLPHFTHMAWPLWLVLLFLYQQYVAAKIMADASVEAISTCVESFGVYKHIWRLGWMVWFLLCAVLVGVLLGLLRTSVVGMSMIMLSLLTLAVPQVAILSIAKTYHQVATVLTSLMDGGCSAKVLYALANTHTLVITHTGIVANHAGKVEHLAPLNDKLSPREILSYAASLEEGEVHALATAIMDAAHEYELDTGKAQDKITVAGQGIEASVNGRQVAIGNEAMMVAVGAGLTGPERALGAQIQSQGCTLVWVLVDGDVVGVIGVEKKADKRVRQTLDSLARFDIKTTLLSHDGRTAVETFAYELGIDDVHPGLDESKKRQWLDAAKKANEHLMELRDEGLIITLGMDTKQEHNVGHGLHVLPQMLAQARRFKHTIKRNLQAWLTYHVLAGIMALLAILIVPPVFLPMSAGLVALAGYAFMLFMAGRHV